MFFICSILPLTDSLFSFASRATIAAAIPAAKERIEGHGQRFVRTLNAISGDARSGETGQLQTVPSI